MPEARIIRLSEGAYIDKDYCLHYGPNRNRVIQPCKEILDKDLNIILIENNAISPTRLRLFGKDRAPICVAQPESGRTAVLDIAGKSAFLNLIGGLVGRALVEHTISTHMDGKPDRRDHLHEATVGSLNEACWYPFWTPIQERNSYYHTRLVAERTILYGEDPTPQDALNLVSAFHKVC